MFLYSEDMRILILRYRTRMAYIEFISTLAGLQYVEVISPEMDARANVKPVFESFEYAGISKLPKIKISFIDMLKYGLLESAKQPKNDALRREKIKPIAGKEKMLLENRITSAGTVSQRASGDAARVYDLAGVLFENGERNAEPRDYVMISFQYNTIRSKVEIKFTFTIPSKHLPGNMKFICLGKLIMKMLAAQCETTNDSFLS